MAHTLGEGVSDSRNRDEHEPRRMVDHHNDRVRLVQMGLAIKGALTVLEITVKSLAPEIGHSQGYLSRVLTTYLALEIDVCEDIIQRFVMALGKRGVTFKERSDEIEIGFHRPLVALGRVYNGAIIGVGGKVEISAEAIGVSRPTLSRALQRDFDDAVIRSQDHLMSRLHQLLWHKGACVLPMQEIICIVFKREKMEFSVGPKIAH